MLNSKCRTIQRTLFCQQEKHFSWDVVALKKSRTCNAGHDHCSTEKPTSCNRIRYRSFIYANLLSHYGAPRTDHGSQPSTSSHVFLTAKWRGKLALEMMKGNQIPIFMHAPWNHSGHREKKTESGGYGHDFALVHISNAKVRGSSLTRSLYCTIGGYPEAESGKMKRDREINSVSISLEIA